MIPDGPHIGDVGRAFSLRPGLVAYPLRNQVLRDGLAAHVEPRVMDLLVFLAARPGEVVSKADLISGVWRAHVADEAVHRAVSLLRNALGDSPRQPTLIETVPRRGYRLLVEPTMICNETRRRGARGRWVASVVAATVAVAAVAVFALQTGREAPQPLPVGVEAPAEAASPRSDEALTAPLETPVNEPAAIASGAVKSRAVPSPVAFAPRPNSSAPAEDGASGGPELAPGEAPQAPRGQGLIGGG